MTLAISGVIIILGLFLSAVFSGAETGLYCVNRLRLHLGVKIRDPRAMRVAKFLEDETGALSVTLVGTNLANFVTTSAVAFALAESFAVAEHLAELYTIAILTPVVFVFGEVVPKSLFQRHADRLLSLISPILMAFNLLFRWLGLVAALKLFSRVLERVLGGNTSGESSFGPKRRLAMMMREATAGTKLAQERSDLIDRVCQLSETPLYEVMVPRNRVVAVPMDTDRRGLIRIARRTGHARLPVFETNPRQLVGVIRVDDLLRRDDWGTVGEELKPVPSLQPHDSVATAIVRLQSEKHGLGVVTDRGGQMLGVVVLKDLLGRLVGTSVTSH